MKEKFFLLILISFLFSACDQKKHSSQSRLVPYSLYLKFEINHQIVPDTTISKIILYYYMNNQKKEIIDFMPAEDPQISGNSNLGIMTSFSIAGISSTQGIKDFFLKYPDGNIDSLYINYQQVSDDEGIKEPCFCRVPLKEIKVNGQSPGIDTTTPEGTPVYLIEMK
jgi:hypothetical protein